MKETKDPAKLADEMLAKREKLAERAAAELGPRTIGRHVLALLERGEPLTVESLRQSLTTETGADSASARWAVERIDAITQPPA
jgi:hypothetical protein